MCLALLRDGTATLHIGVRMSGSRLARMIGSIAALSVAAAGATRAEAQCVQRDTPNIIQPGDPTWALDKNVYPNSETNGATPAIPATNPRSGLGSLQLSPSGSLFDWDSRSCR